VRNTIRILVSIVVLLPALASAADSAAPGWMTETPPPMLRGAVPGTGGVEASRAATAEVYDPAKMTYVPWKDAAVIQPLPAGARMPADSMVVDQRGDRFDLNAAVARQPTILIFYRGGWCPYCNAHLRDLQQSEAELRKLGYQILAISPDTPAQLRATAATGQLSYMLLSDSRLEVAAKFGLRYQLDERYIAHVKAKPDQREVLAHVDLRAQTGGYLLTPGAFILDRSGKIRFVYVNNNYSVRVKQGVLLDAARKALE
jgi:peroxiredoxin